MAEQKIIDTLTIVTRVVPDIEIDTFYVGASQTYVFIADNPGISNGVPYEQGDGVVVKDNIDLDFYVNSLGELIIDDNGGNAERFSIDNDTGELFETI
jgi:hypothetical protein